MLQILPNMETGYPVAIDGYLVPRVRLIKYPNTDETGIWGVTLDGRMSIDASKDEMQRWLWLLANAQAVSEGWSCHGEHSTRKCNPHQINVGVLTMFGPNGALQTLPADTLEG